MNLLRYIGHFHPVVVHLPIGILLAAMVLEWLSHRKGYRKLRKATRILWLLGFLSAVVACLTGYLHSQSGEFDDELLNLHQWLGISSAAVALAVLLLARRKLKNRSWVYLAMILILGVLIVLAGHAGGKLTHGADFLKPPPLSAWFGADATDELGSVNLKTAFLYADAIEPILEKKCKSCHGPLRQKGKLRLDDPEFILKGGKDGPVVDGREGELFKRIHLGLNDEDHMPPSGKDQLSRREIILLSYWIEKGAGFTAQLNTLPGADSIVRLLENSREYPEEVAGMKAIAPPAEGIIRKLHDGGVVCSFLAQGNGYVSLNFEFADTTLSSGLLRALPEINTQLVELKLKDCKFSHPDWVQLARLTSLTGLNLANSNVTDEDVISIRPMGQLSDLNLVGTRVTIAGLRNLRLPELAHLFLYRSGINEKDTNTLHALFPHTEIDFGDYNVPTTRADTTLVTKPNSTPVH